MQKKEYGLFTAITLIIGTVIGSGIFFKSDNILVFTGGDVLKGVIIFTIAAIGIVFGSLTIAVLASKTKNPGGVITYADEFINKKTACAFGWFQTFIYFPAISSVIAWVCAVYLCMFLGIESTNTSLFIISIIVLVFIYILNVFSANIGGHFQNVATIVKLIPLFLIAIIGMLRTGETQIFYESANTTSNSLFWISAVGPIAFSYDGWVVATSVAHEIKNSERNLPIALIVAPVFILIIYIMYFVGICAIVGPENIMAYGDAHVNVAAQKIFGNYGAKIILGFVVISVLGTLNGFTLAYIRLPYSLSIRGMFPSSEKISKIDDKTKMPINSAVTTFTISMIWFIVNYIVMSKEFIPNSDISETPIVIGYALYIVLYVTVIRMHLKEKNIGFIRGIIVPILAIIGSLIVIFGGISNPMTIFYVVLCVIIIFASVKFMKSVKE